MSWNTIYLLANYWAFAGWALLAFAPRSPRILSFVMYAGVFLLCLLYVVLIAGFLSGGIDPGGQGSGGDFSSLAGVMKLFDTPGGTTMGWVHYLAFDLFTGMWIARDADAKGISRFIQAPILLATLMAGPVGLGVWLLAREPAARRQGRFR